MIPIDWLVIENVLNIKQANLEHETKLTLKSAFARILKEERKARDILERTLGRQGEMMAERDSVAEDAHQCHYCTDWAYLSYVQCRHHKINYCIVHQLLCHCPPQNVRLVYRYTSRELDQMER